MAEKDEIEKIFQRLSVHKDRILNGLTKLDDHIFAFLKIISCNASGSDPFTKARCETERFSNLFGRFIELFDVNLLRKFLDTGKIEIGDRLKKPLLRALKTLAGFLEKEYNELNHVLTTVVDADMLKQDWVRLYTTHVLRKLSSSKRVVISDAGYSSAVGCYCRCSQKLQYGDTSMGNKNTWHGSVDVLMGNVAVDFTNPAEESEETADTSGSTYELKTDNLEQHTHQIQTQSITLACVDRCVNGSAMSPLVAVTLNEFKMYLYDYNSDIFIESEEFLFRPPVPVSSVLALWLIINHCLFEDPEGLGYYRKSGFFADFKKFLFEKKETYEKDMHFMRCKKVHRQKDALYVFKRDKMYEDDSHMVLKKKKENRGQVDDVEEHLEETVAARKGPVGQGDDVDETVAAKKRRRGQGDDVEETVAAKKGRRGQGDDVEETVAAKKGRRGQGDDVAETVVAEKGRIGQGDDVEETVTAKKGRIGQGDDVAETVAAKKGRMGQGDDVAETVAAKKGRMGQGDDVEETLAAKKGRIGQGDDDEELDKNNDSKKKKKKTGNLTGLKKLKQPKKKCCKKGKVIVLWSLNICDGVLSSSKKQFASIGRNVCRDNIIRREKNIFRFSSPPAPVNMSRPKANSHHYVTFSAISLIFYQV